ncbi:MAG: S8 family peptidase [Elusimicrobiota bacterium]
MMRCFAAICLTSLFLVPPTNAAAPLGAEGVQDRMMLMFQQDVPLREQKQIAESRGLEVLRVFAPINALVVRSKPGTIRPSAFQLMANPRIGHVAQDFYTNWLYGAPAMPRLPALGEVMQRLKPLNKEIGKAPKEIQWGVDRVHAPEAWKKTRGAGVKVAVVDTGIDPKHTEFAGRIKGGYNAIDKEQPWDDDHSHGTHVAGIIAAALDGKGVVGVAPEAELYAVKVLSKDGSGSLFGIIGGIMWCIENKMDVVNMSLGSSQGNFMFQFAVKRMEMADIPLIAAAGNDGGPVGYPAAYSGAIAVSALCPPGGADDARLCSGGKPIATFSSRGPEIEFIAPGVLIPSTVLNNGIKAYSGTSMASPHVAGLAALAVANGARGAKAVRRALTRSAYRIQGMSAEEQGYGVIDASKLVD